MIGAALCILAGAGVIFLLGRASGFERGQSAAVDDITLALLEEAARLEARGLPVDAAAIAEAAAAISSGEIPRAAAPVLPLHVEC